MRISDWSSDVCSSDLALLLLLGAVGEDRVHAQRRLHAGEAAQDAVAALEFLADQAVADTVEAGTAVFLRQGRAKQAAPGDLGDKLGREATLVDAVTDDWRHARVGETGTGFLASTLPFVQPEAERGTGPGGR